MSYRQNIFRISTGKYYALSFCKRIKQVIHLAFLYFPKNIRCILRENWEDLYFVIWSRFMFGSRSVMVLDSLTYKCRRIFILFRYMYLHGDAWILPTALTNLHFSPLLFSLQEHLIKHIFTQKCSLTILKLFFLMWIMETILYDFGKSQKAKSQL